jgi:hypothetical protein
MIIDIEPKIQIGNPMQLILKMRDIDAFYVIKHENGDDFSVMFTNEEFKKFIPSSILSTQLLSWTAGINIEYKKKAVRKQNQTK